MSSYANNNWDHVLNSTNSSHLTNNLSGPDFDFGTLHWDDGRDGGIAPAPAAAPTTLSTPVFSNLAFDTPHRDQVPFNAPVTPAMGDDFTFPLSPFEPFHLTTSHLQAANEHFDRANEHADVVLAIGHNRANERASTRPLAGTGRAANLPRGPMPSHHTRVPLTDEVRKSIGRSSAAGKKGKKRVEEEADEVVEVEDSDSDENENGGRTEYDGPRLLKAAGAAVDQQPYLAPYRGKGAAWQRVVVQMKKQKVFRGCNISAASVKQKVDSLVKFKKNGCKDEKLKSLLGTGDADAVTMGALLEQLEAQYDAAKNKSDSAKAQIKKKNDEDKAGGEAIRQASMKTLGKRGREVTPSSDGDISDSGASTNPAHGASRPVAASSSIEVLNSDDENTSKVQKNKRRRRNDRSSETTELFAIMKAENERRAKHDEQVAQQLGKFVDNCSAQKDEYISLLRELITKGD
ncbi:hypothetical protein DFH06DRAFT_1335115 [Mycena polygramma]|nr:hypothetical protein DFH06DRAFT_1335115 [Mycena polygramma]